jgi:hypothetical protein
MASAAWPYSLGVIGRVLVSLGDRSFASLANFRYIFTPHLDGDAALAMADPSELKP